MLRRYLAVGVEMVLRYASQSIRLLVPLLLKIIFQGGVSSKEQPRNISMRFRCAGRFMMAGSSARLGSLCALDDEI